MKRDILKTSVLTVFGRTLGFLVPFFIAAWFGSTKETDAFFLAFGIILFASLVINYLFETVVVPYVAESRSRREDLGALLGGVATRSTLVLSVLIALLLWLLPFLLRKTANLEESTIDLTWILLAVMSPVVFFVTWTSLLNGALVAFKHFNIPALSPGFRSLTVLGVAFAFKGALGIHALAAGYVCGEALRFAVSAVAFKKHIGNFKIAFKASQEVQRFFRNAMFQMAGFAFLYFVPVLNQFMVTWAGPGEVSIYSYAERLRNVPFLLVSTGTVMVIMSHWAHQYSSDRKGFDWAGVRRKIFQVAGVSFLLGAVLIVLRPLFVPLIFGHGSFSQENVPVVSTLFAVLIVSLPFDAVGLLCVRLLIILRRDLAFTLFTAVKLAGTGLLNVWLIPKWGVYGAGMSFTGMNMIYALFLYLAAARAMARKTVPENSP